MSRAIHILVISCCLGLLAFAGRADVQPLTPCGTVVADTKLQSDCAGPLVVEASNITVDLNGHAVRCITLTFPGILIAEQTNVRIKDGTITQCRGGIRANGGGGHTFRKLNIVENQGAGDGSGIQFVASSDNKVMKSTIRGHDASGVESIFSDNNRVMDCDISFNAHGVFIADGSADEVKGSRITANHFAGVALRRTNHSNVSLNISSQNGVGIELHEGAQFTTVQENTANNNGRGIVVHLDATNNSVADNEALNNTTDLEDDNPNCDSNTWRNNEFTTRVAAPVTCIQ